jgi:hypothetical protein
LIPQPFRAGLTFGGRPSGPRSPDRFLEKHFQDEPAELQIPFDFAQGRLSTSLRSGRDDNSYLGQGCECPRKIGIPTKVTNSRDDKEKGDPSTRKKFFIPSGRPKAYQRAHVCWDECGTPKRSLTNIGLMSLRQCLRSRRILKVAPVPRCKRKYRSALQCLRTSIQPNIQYFLFGRYPKRGRLPSSHYHRSARPHRSKGVSEQYNCYPPSDTASYHLSRTATT